MFKKSRRRDDEPEVEANMIPILSTMFLLIPALLLAMEIAPFSSVYVEPPKFSDVSDVTTTETPEKLRLRVHVRQDGFTARYGASAESEQSVDIPLGNDGKHDYVALEQRAADLKALFPDDAQVNISAENGIDYGTLVQSMDALRGQECSLKGALYGEREPDSCYFWSVVVQSGTV